MGSETKGEHPLVLNPLEIHSLKREYVHSFTQLQTLQ